MSSPLAFIANAHLVIREQGVPTAVNGRITTTPGATYAVRLYLVRQDSKGVDTGWSETASDSMLSGASGPVRLRRGYALGYAAWTPGAPWPTSVTGLSPTSRPAWLQDGLVCTLHNGTEPPTQCELLATTGRYGGEGIDAMVAVELGGIPVLVRSSSTLN
jgi:hypothetical protein